MLNVGNTRKDCIKVILCPAFHGQVNLKDADLGLFFFTLKGFPMGS